VGIRVQQQPEGSQEQALGGAEEAEIAHLHKAPGQDVLEEAMDELLGGESAELELVGSGRAVAKGNLVVFEFDQTAVADGDPEDVRSQILEGGASIADRFAVDDPFLLPDGSRDIIVGEVRLLEGVKEFSPENSGESLDREQEVMMGRQPGAVIS
jgi:hypothetical protein